MSLKKIVKRETDLRSMTRSVLWLDEDPESSLRLTDEAFQPQLP